MSERPTGGSGYTDLSDFQTSAVTSATSYWGSGNSAGFVNNPTHTSVTMITGTGVTLATTTNLDSTSDFTNNWVDCHG